MHLVLKSKQQVQSGNWSITKMFWGRLLFIPETKIAKFANTVVLDEVAHDEPPHLDLHC